jgi:hypothetical protein
MNTEVAWILYAKERMLIVNNKRGRYGNGALDDHLDLDADMLAMFRENAQRLKFPLETLPLGDYHKTSQRPTLTHFSATAACRRLAGPGI